MEKNKNHSNLDEGDAIKHFSLGSLMAKERKSSDSSPNFAQELIDSIKLTSFNNSNRAGGYYLKVETIISPVNSYNYSDGGLFCLSQDKLTESSWNHLRKVSRRQL